LNSVVNDAARWRSWAVTPALLLVLTVAIAAAGVTWLKVANTIRHPDPLAIPDRPPIAGIVWANRVFLDQRALERWLEGHGRSYDVWARKHPAAVALLSGRRQSPRRA
jgi:hypothetical protein